MQLSLYQYIRLQAGHRQENMKQRAQAFFCFTIVRTFYFDRLYEQKEQPDIPELSEVESAQPNNLE